MLRHLLLLLFGLPAVLMSQPLGRLTENPSYYSYRGKPLLIVASGEHYGAVVNEDFDWRRYLAALEAQGMNYTRIFTGGGYIEPPGAFGIPKNTLAPRPGRFLAPWARTAEGKFDLGEFNPAYFERLRAFVAEAERRGVIVEVTFFTSIYGEEQWKISPFHPENRKGGGEPVVFRQVHTLNNGRLLDAQLRLARRIVTELNEFDNILYEVQNEPWADQPAVRGVVNPYLRPPQRDQWPNVAEGPSEASMAWQIRIAEEVAAAEKNLPKKHLVAWNWSNFKDALRPLPAPLGAVHFHYAFPEAAIWNRALRVPVGCDETGFMGAEDHHYRRQAWEFILSGGALYNHLDYSFTVGQEDGTEVQPKAPGGGSPALRKQFRALRQMVETLPFWRMTPDLQVVRAAHGAATSAFSLPGDAYVIYGWGAGVAEWTLSVPPGRWRAEWLDAEKGEIQPAQEIRAGTGPLVMKTPPYGQDLALRLTRVR
jgi:hypothetical protein